MSRELCLHNLREADRFEIHICTLKWDHPGPHTCTLDEHERVRIDEDDEDDGWACNTIWDSSPSQMRRGAWRIEFAEARDVIAARQWSKNQWLIIDYVGDSVIVGHNERKQERVVSKKDFEWELRS